MRQSHIEAQPLPCQFSRGNERSQRDYDPRHDDMLDGSVVERSLVGVVGEAHVAVSEILGVRETTDKNVRHDGRFDKLKLHDGFPSKSHCCLAHDQGPSHRGAASRVFDPSRTVSFSHSFQLVKVAA